jgi:dienelactone hydrolase
VSAAAVRRGCLAAVLAALVGAAQAQQRVAFASLDAVEGRPVPLVGFWFAAPQAKAPAVVLLHGCGGAYDRHGALSVRMRDYAALLNAQGAHALVLDSLMPRGQASLCTQRIGQRSITQANRRLDALAALAWLAQRSDVDAAHIGLLGWSNGGSTVLAAINARHPAVAAAAVRASFAAAFYPGCEAELKRGFETATPLLMLVGEADDWTPARPCHELAQRATGVAPQIEGYEGAYHEFDSSAPLRLRKNVPNGANPGQGVHAGGQPQAREQSRERLIRFLAEVMRG